MHAARATLLSLQIRAAGYESKRGPGEENPPSIRSPHLHRTGGSSDNLRPHPRYNRKAAAIGAQELEQFQNELDMFTSTVMETLAADVKATGASAD